MPQPQPQPHGLPCPPHAPQGPPVPVTSKSQLPSSLRNAVAQLQVANPGAPGGATQVWLLGVSHVSRASCDQVSGRTDRTMPVAAMRDGATCCTALPWSDVPGNAG